MKLIVHGGNDTDGFGPETFTDLISPHTRKFTYGICAVTVPSSTNFTITVQDTPAGGTLHIATAREFPISTTMTTALLKLKA